MKTIVKIKLPIAKITIKNWLPFFISSKSYNYRINKPEDVILYQLPKKF